MNGDNRLECYVTLGWIGLPVANTLAYSTDYENKVLWIQALYDFSDDILTQMSLGKIHILFLFKGDKQTHWRSYEQRDEQTDK
jgi:hypothetical protein